MQTVVGILLVALPAVARAGTFTTDWNSALPSNVTLTGRDGKTAIHETGTATGGRVRLTPAASGENGRAILDDLDPGVAVAAFSAHWRIGAFAAGTAADGYSFSFSEDVPAASGSDTGKWACQQGESVCEWEGLAAGLALSFDEYEDCGAGSCAAGGGDNARRVTLRYNGVTVAASDDLGAGGLVPGFANVDVIVRPDGAARVWFNNQPVIDTTIPGWSGVAGRKFVWAAATGGESVEHLVEEVTIATFSGEATAADFTTLPAGATLLGDASLSGGVLQLTPNSSGQTGALVLADLDNGAALRSFVARFSARVWDGDGADGVSFNFGNLPTAGSAFGESGWAGTAAGRDGLTVRFVTDSASGGPKIEVVYSRNGSTQNVASIDVAAIRNSYYADIAIAVTASGRIAIGSTLGGDLDGDNTRDSLNSVHLQETQITGWSPDPGWRFGWGASTGGTTDRHTIDDVLIETIACGNGQLEAGESCDDGNTAAGDCCSPTCGFESAATVCRPSAGTCDVAETCTGSSDDCPADAFEPATTVCRPVSGGDSCDVAESCTGTATACPADAVAPAGTECRGAAGVCDVAETCDGTGKACPADAVQPSSTVCRAASTGETCDVTETCDGTNATCPADAVRPSGAVCRAAAGTCDAAEVCDGAAKVCPGDAKLTGTCRAAAGVCDVAEVCDGSGNACPADAFAPDGTNCEDGRFCNGVQACTAGACGGGTSPCGAGESCNEWADTCFPGSCPTEPAVCRTGGKGTLLIKNSDDEGKDMLAWKFLDGEATTQADFADPTSTASYALCFYAGRTPTLLQVATVPPGDGWSRMGPKGYKYFGFGEASGITKLTLTGGEAGRSRVLLKGRGANLPDFDGMLPIASADLPMVVQLRNNQTGICWQGTLAALTKNLDSQFSARQP